MTTRLDFFRDEFPCFVAGCARTAAFACEGCGIPLCSTHLYPFLYFARMVDYCPICYPIFIGVLKRRDVEADA